FSSVRIMRKRLPQPALMNYWTGPGLQGAPACATRKESRCYAVKTSHDAMRLIRRGGSHTGIYRGTLMTRLTCRGNHRLRRITAPVLLRPQRITTLMHT